MEHSNIQLPSHQQRVIDEQIELLDKIIKINSFMETDFFKTLPEEEQKTLDLQSKFMDSYNNILLLRIKRF